MSYFVFENKRLYYNEFSTGKPLLFLHGNTASSNMYAQIAEKYKQDFKVVLLDFLGHGKSDRLNEFPTDLWFYEAQQVIAFLKHKQYADMNIIGSSGGAMVAINVALEAPELVSKVIADSFEGEKPHKAFTENLLKDREHAKSDNNARNFYSYMHGDDWEQVVDNDTTAIIRHEKEIGQFFHKPLQFLKTDILLTGSREDEFMSVIANNYLENIYKDMLQKIGHGKLHLFNSGGHPAMITNQDEFYKISLDYLLQ